MTHGTPHDHPDCKTDLSCVNHRTDLMTCREAVIRYSGDYSYRKAVDAGTATAEREVFAKPERPKVPKAPKIGSKRREPKPKREPKPRQYVGIIGPDGHVHGTAHGYRSCRDADGCPAIAAGLPSCLVAGRAVALASWRRRHGQKPKRVVKHGTESGYVMLKCRAADVCPSETAGGVSCSGASSAAARARYAEKKGTKL